MRYASNVTILTPTKDRRSFVALFIRSLETLGFGGKLVLCDSSPASVFEATQNDLNRLRPGFMVVHEHLPDQNNTEALKASLHHVDSPYSLFIPDDDIPIPRTVERCTQFLEAKPDYAAATGRAVILQVSGNRVVDGGAYKINRYEQAAPADRLQALLGSYSVVHYSVSRSDEFQQRLRTAAAFRDPYFGLEILNNGLHVIDGKIGAIDGLIVVRQNHDARISQRGFVDWMLRENWSSSAHLFVEIISQHLSLAQPMPFEEARKLVMSAFQSYLHRATRPAAASGSPAFTDDARKWLRSIPLLRLGRKSLRVLFPGATRNLTLDALLRPSSPDHDDFIPIYNAITMAQ